MRTELFRFLFHSILARPKEKLVVGISHGYTNHIFIH